MGKKEPVHEVSEYGQSKAAWLERFTAQAKAGFLEGEEVEFEATAVDASIDSMLRLSEEQPAVAALLATKGVDEPFFATMGELRGRYNGARAALPEDRRSFELLSPEDKQLVIDAHGLLLLFKQAGTAAAKSTATVKVMHALGRGAPVQPSPRGVLRAIEQFLVNVPKRKKVLADMGFGAEEKAEMEGLAARLKGVLRAKEKRSQDKKKGIQATDVPALAIERAFELYRARAMNACRHDAEARRTALEVLPRRPDRRRTARPATTEATKPTG